MNGAQGSRALGYIFAIVQAVFYSTMSTFGKLLYGMGLDSSQVMVVRFLSTTVLLGAFLLIWRRPRLISRDKGVALQALFFFFSAWFYFLTAQHLTAGLTTVIFYLFPAVVALINTCLFHERLHLSTGIALVLCIGGTCIVSEAFIPGQEPLDPLGLLFGFLSCLSFAIYTVVIQRTGKDENAFTATFTISALCLLASLIVFAPSLPGLIALSTPYVWGIGALIALLNTILPIVLYIIAVKRIGSTRASLLSITETPFSLLFAFILLGEVLDFWQALGTVLIVSGIVIVTAEPLFSRRHENADSGTGE